MPILSRYCKAYPLHEVAEWKEWQNKLKSRIDSQPVSGEMLSADYIFIQENYTVTAGIFLDENILLDDVTEEWKEFCTHTLGFNPPQYPPAQ
jgi:hypothetical protein